MRMGRRERVGNPKERLEMVTFCRERAVLIFAIFILARRDENGQTGKTGALTTHQTTIRIVAMGKTMDETYHELELHASTAVPSRKAKGRGKEEKGWGEDGRYQTNKSTTKPPNDQMKDGPRGGGTRNGTRARRGRGRRERANNTNEQGSDDE